MRFVFDMYVNRIPHSDHDGIFTASLNFILLLKLEIYYQFIDMLYLLEFTFKVTS